MPKKSSIELENESGWRYASVSLPKNMMLFLDRIANASSQAEAFGEDGFNANRTHIPSRRIIVQDAIEMYVRNLYPEMLEDYIQMLKDNNMFQRQDAYNRWIVQHEINMKELADLKGENQVDATSTD